MIAVIRIRGKVNLSPAVRTTLQSLRLGKKHTCLLTESKPEILGMIKRVKDFVTWGDVSEATVQQLQSSGEGSIFFLHPPRGGFERKGIKTPFTKGGALGFRKDGIDGLIMKMQKEVKKE